MSDSIWNLLLKETCAVCRDEMILKLISVEGSSNFVEEDNLKIYISQTRYMSYSNIYEQNMQRILLILRINCHRD